MTQSDEERMQAVGRGDLDAFRDLVLAYQLPAWRVAVRCLHDPAEAEDIVQEAFCRILQAAPRYRPLARFRTYFFQVVTRLCIDAAAKKHPHYTDEVFETSDPSPNPVESLVTKEAAAEVERALKALPPNQRMALILHHSEGLRYAEIAQAMGISIKAVEGLIARARSALQPRLGTSREK